MNEGEMTGRHLCQCIPGTEGPYDSLCQACPAGKYQPFNYTYPDGSDFESGAHEAVATFCLSCPEGNFNNSQQSTACLPCPPHSESPLNSDSVLDCVCSPGFFGPDGGSAAPAQLTSFVWEGKPTHSVAHTAPQSRMCNRRKIVSVIPDTYQPRTTCRARNAQQDTIVTGTSTRLHVQKIPAV